MVASYAKMGRPVDPDSEASQKPWEKLGISRASFYWKKRYGDLPTEPIPVNLRRTSPRRTAKPSPSWAAKKVSRLRRQTALQELAALRSLL